MAQAARLSLRMQKELKLLLTDPPPGASFPHLSSDDSSDLSSFSLSTIHAQIEGPEGTVYSEGIFKIKIQIPERYPFQPPIVTFATPIYHPNIDNGGRICLDILNLPPKGAWQPSLNISTVLTSIGLLLSEPNPDDGLMCEASKEYKYNRQAFDQKARSMTEKYAMSGASESDNSIQSLHSHPTPNTVEAKESDLSKCEVNKHIVSSKKLSGISKKLSLVSPGSNQRQSDKRVNEVPADNQSESRTEVDGTKQESKDMLNEYSQNHEKLIGTRRKLSLESFGPSQKKNGDSEDNVGPNQGSSLLNPQSLSMASSESLAGTHYKEHPHQHLHEAQDFKSINDSTNRRSDDSENLNKMHKALPLETASHGTLPMPMAISHNEMQPQKGDISRTESGFTNTKRKKLGLAGRKPYLGPLLSFKNQDGGNKENVAPLPNLLSLKKSQIAECHEEKSENCDANVAPKKPCRIGRKLPLEPVGHLHSENLNETPSKALPMAYDSVTNEKQQQNRDEKIAEGIEQGGEESPVPEDVIVLDSEDSEEESHGPLRSKLSLARKRLPVKWKA